ncbi:GCD1 Nucleoside-diphosphate-sugar pyrophosphorylase involved in lipopolysaccharide biosynthesis/translation initiation factor 2B, gamma/epsilon subunits (eIF-2Bgamma/eIF-2Bepsilon) [Methylophilaceae bacterium]
MTHSLKGMILAAGQGTRVRPLTKDMPKPMIPILGKPVMEYLIEHLARHGVKEIMVNVAHLNRKIEQYFSNGQRWGVQIGYSYEGQFQHGELTASPVGSAGGMRRIQDFGGFFDQTTIVLCGDALIDLDITAALLEHKKKRALVSVVTMQVPQAEVANYGIVETDEDGRVVSFQEKPQPSAARSNLASTGIYFFEPAALNLIPANQNFDIGSQLFPLLVEKNLPFYAQNRHYNWIDIGRISDYWEVLQRVLRGEISYMKMPGIEVRPGIWVGLNTRIDWDKVNITGPVYIDSGTQIEAGAEIVGPCWISHGSRIGKNAKVIRSILFEYTGISDQAVADEMIVSASYCVDRAGVTYYLGDDSCPLRWGDARR